MPYVKFGLGAAWNKVAEDTYGAHIGDKEVTVHSPSWSGRSFVHGLGFGVDFIASCNLWVSLGYQYDNYGVVKIKQPNFTLPGEGGDKKEEEAPSKPDDVQNADTEGGEAQETVLKPVNSQKMLNLGNFKTHSVQLTVRYFFG